MGEVRGQRSQDFVRGTGPRRYRARKVAAALSAFESEQQHYDNAAKGEEGAAAELSR
jgi:hypothetical protein